MTDTVSSVASARKIVQAADKLAGKMVTDLLWRREAAPLKAFVSAQLGAAFGWTITERDAETCLLGSSNDARMMHFEGPSRDALQPGPGVVIPRSVVDAYMTEKGFVLENTPDPQRPKFNTYRLLPSVDYHVRDFIERVIVNGRDTAPQVSPDSEYYDAIQIALMKPEVIALKAAYDEHRAWKTREDFQGPNGSAVLAAFLVEYGKENEKEIESRQRHARELRRQQYNQLRQEFERDVSSQQG